MVGGRRVRLFKHGVIHGIRHAARKYLHLLCMGVWALEDTNCTVSQGLILIAPQACILLIFLLLVNDHNTILLQNFIITVIVLFATLPEGAV